MSTTTNGAEERARQPAPVPESQMQQLEREIESILEVAEEIDMDTAPLTDFLNKELPLSNLTEAQLHEFRWLLENRILEIQAQHPPEQSHVRGAARAVWLQHEDRDETPLTVKEERRLRTIKERIKNLARRALEGFQQEEISKRREEVEQHAYRHEDDERGGLM